MPGFHAGRPPRNKGLRYPPDPPTVEEIVAVMRIAGDRMHGRRLRGLVVVLWRAGLRIDEALALREAALFVAISAVALAAGSRAGATRAAKRHTITYVKRYGITLRAADLDLQCSNSRGRGGGASWTQTTGNAPAPSPRPTRPACTPTALPTSTSAVGNEPVRRAIARTSVRR
jgi:hypothetical protein